MSKAEGTKGAVVQTNRRTWDVEEYQAKLEARLAEDALAEGDAASAKTFSGTVAQRDKLDRDRSRAQNNLQIDKMVGKTMVVTGNTPIAQQGGFFCTVCECIVKDSISWLDHINGKKHNRALGMNMRVERASVEQVQKRLKTHKPSDRRSEKPVDDERSALDDLDARIDKLREEEERERDAKREEKRAKKEAEEAEKKAGLADGFEAMMGFGGFGSSKK